MNEAEIRAVVERVLRELENRAAPPAPQAQEALPDIARVDLKTQYLVDAPKDREAFRTLKEKTPARVGAGHAGARHRTATMLRFQADHAAAQDAVFSDVSDEFLLKIGLERFQTLCRSRDEFLTRPDRGRDFAPETIEKIVEHAGRDKQVLLYVADGLSSTAVEACAPDLLPVLQKGLEGLGISVARPFFVRYGRVGTMDALGEATGAQAVCVLLGERPGLVTAQSMSAYLAYRPARGMPESRRTVLANIHRGGTPVVEAGAHLVELIAKILEEKASGLDLKL